MEESVTQLAYLIPEIDDEPPLFNYFVSVRLKPNEQGIPEASIEWRYPSKELPNADKQVMGMINEFCFPDSSKFPKVKISNKNKKFSFVVTSVDNVKRFGYCSRHLVGDFNLSNKGKRYAICHCVLSLLPCHALFDNILEVANTLSKENLMVLLYKLHKQKIPFPGHSISVSIPGQLDHPQDYLFTRPEDDQSLSGFASFQVLLKLLDPLTIITIIISMLFERRIIFLSKKLSLLSNCVQACVALISPFVWQHVFIPVLPVKMITFVCAPVPFVVGVLKLHLDKIHEQSDAMEEVIMVDLDRSNMEPPSNDIKLVDDDYLFPFLNQVHCAKSLMDEQEKKKHSYKNLLKRGSQGRMNDMDRNQESIKTLLLNGFTHFILNTAGHFKHYNRGSSFDKEGFINENPKLEKFLTLLSGSQLFEQFVSDVNNEISFEKRKSQSSLLEKPFRKEELCLREGFLNKFRKGGLFGSFSGGTEKGYFQNKFIKLTCERIFIQKYKNNESEMAIELKEIVSSKIIEYQGYINCLEIVTGNECIYLQSNDEANINTWLHLILWRLELLKATKVVEYPKSDFTSKRFNSFGSQNLISVAKMSSHRTKSESSMKKPPTIPSRDAKPTLKIPMKRPIPKSGSGKKIGGSRPLPKVPPRNYDNRSLPKLPPK